MGLSPKDIKVGDTIVAVRNSPSGIIEVGTEYTISWLNEYNIKFEGDNDRWCITYLEFFEKKETSKEEKWMELVRLVLQGVENGDVKNLAITLSDEHSNYVIDESTIDYGRILLERLGSTVITIETIDCLSDTHEAIINKSHTVHIKLPNDEVMTEDDFESLSKSLSVTLLLTMMKGSTVTYARI